MCIRDRYGLPLHGRRYAEPDYKEIGSAVMARMTKEELLEKLFHDDYEHLKGKKLRMTRVRVPGKDVYKRQF